MLAVLLYLALVLACVTALPALAASQAPLADAARALAGPGLASLVAAGTSVSALGIAFGMMVTTPRYLSALAAGERTLFELDRYSPRGVPLRALAVTWVVVSLVVSLGELGELFVLSSIAVLLQFGTSALALAGAGPAARARARAARGLARSAHARGRRAAGGARSDSPGGARRARDDRRGRRSAAARAAARPGSRRRRLAEIWRYPVKSMAGERLAAAELRRDGIEGDRLVQAWDERDRIVTARTRPGLLALRAALGRIVSRASRASRSASGRGGRSASAARSSAWRTCAAAA